MEQALAARLRRRRALALRHRTTALRLARPPRRWVVVGLAALVLVCGGFVWFRTSPFVRVSHVRITGVQGPDATAIERALAGRARQMSTMAASAGALEAAVAQFHVVRSVAVATSFPHTATIAVEEQLPVATLVAGGGRTAAAANGVVLGEDLISPGLPTVSVAEQLPTGRVVAARGVRGILTVLGAAPAPLRAMVSKAYMAAEGLTVRMSSGLLVYFGNASRPHAKWASLAAVLGSPASAGATYVDVRVPERPAAGTGSESSMADSSQEVTATDPNSAALAESLARAVAGEEAAPVESTGSLPAEGSAESTEALPAEESTEALPAEEPTEALPAE